MQERSLSQSAHAGVQLTQADSAWLADQRAATKLPLSFGSGCVSQDGIIFEYMPMKTGESAYSLGLDFETVPPERPLEEKLHDFVAAAAHRATDPDGWKSYFLSQQEKALGIGDGLNLAKEEIKKAAARGITSLLDGTAVNAVLHPQPAIEQLCTTADRAIGAMAADPQAVNKVMSALGSVTMTASEKYSQMSPREQGRVIGEVMFGMVNPEGSTKAAEGALKVADQVATHVDGAVVDAIQKSMKATTEMAQSAPELMQQSKQMLYDYTRKLGLGAPELEYAGIPKGYFDDIAKAVDEGKPDYFYAASRRERANDWHGELSREVPSSRGESKAFRGDSDMHSTVNDKGRRKAHINEDGDLVPADLHGIYKGRKVSIVEHIEAQACRRAKEHSPYISFGTKDGVVAKYGGTGIELELQALRDAIAKGELAGVKIYEHEDVVEKIRNSYFKRYAKVKCLEYVAKDKEILVEGVIPKRFLKLWAKNEP